MHSNRRPYAKSAVALLMLGMLAGCTSPRGDAPTPSESRLQIGGWQIELTPTNTASPGIVRIQHEGIDLLAPGSHPFPELMTLDEGRRVPLAGAWQSARIRGNGIDLVHIDGPRGRMEFGVQTQQYGGLAWEVLTYRYRIESPVELAAVKDQLAFAVGGGGDSLEVAMQRFAGGDAVMIFGWLAAGPDEVLRTGMQPAYACAQPWDAQFNEGLMLLKWPDVTDTTIWNGYDKPAGAVGVRYRDRWNYGRSHDVTTSWMNLGLATDTVKDDWINAARDLSRAINAQYGLTPVEPLPWGYTHHSSNFPRNKDGLEVAQPFAAWLEDHFPPFKDMGLARMGVLPIWRCDATERVGHNACLAIHDLQIPAAMGDLDDLRELTGELDEQGLSFVVWAPLSLSLESPLWDEHPHWKMENPDGSHFTSHYRDIGGAHLGRGFGSYLVTELVGLHQQAGVGGIWWDSYPTFGPHVDFAMEEPRGMLPELLQTTALLRHGGIDMIIEGFGPLGLPAVLIHTHWMEHWAEDYERGFFDTAPVFRHPTEQGRRVWNPPPAHYLRFLANRSTPALDARQIPEDERDFYRAANKAFRAALPHMQRSLPDPEPGLRAWTSVDGQTWILFQLGDASCMWPTEKWGEIINLMTGQPLLLERETVELHPYQVYRLSLKPEGSQ